MPETSATHVVRNMPSRAAYVWVKLPTSGPPDFGELVIDNNTKRITVESGRYSALGEYAGLIHAGGVLESPAAIFQGLRRPYIAEGLDDFIYVYVSNPAKTFYYAARDRFDGTGPHEAAAPAGSVFVSFVSFSQDVLKLHCDMDNSANENVRGVLLAWEWTKASVDDRRFPEAHQARYRRKLWPA